MTLDYFYGAQADQFAFYRIPKALFTDERFKSISAEAKILYGILLDRMSLSRKNGWLDEQGRVFIIFTLEEVMEAIGCADQKATKLLNELDSKAGLIERKRQGLGKPNLIFVKNFVDNSDGSIPPAPESRIKTRENHDSADVNFTTPESRKSRGSNTDSNYTDLSETETYPFPSGQGGGHGQAPVDIQVHFSPFTAEWSISGKSQPSYNDVNAYMTYGTERANAYRILEDTLNLRDVRIYDTVTDPDGKERRVLNSKETTLAQQKQQAIKDAFSEWIWKDPDRRQELVTRYNELFNSNRSREYDGSHITFSGMNPEIHLREHQLNAVAHILYGGNTLLAHEVGAGKTFEMVAAAMESKRLGLCHKPMFVVPNHLTEQWASEFLRLYPSANILAATKKDFEPKNRKKFCARIATGDYDAIIIGHSQFERIPVSMERQERLLREQIDEVTEGIEELKNSRAERFTIKSMERTKKGLETKLKKLLESGRKDDVVTFEELGVDRLYAREHGELPLYRESYQANIACKEAIEEAISENYGNNRLNSQAVFDAVSAEFSMERIQYVLANTVQYKDWDGRISRANREWAQTVPVVPNPDAWGGDRNCYFVVDRPHTGLTDLFITHFRKELEKAPREKKPSVLKKLQNPLPDTAPKPGREKAQEL